MKKSLFLIFVLALLSLAVTVCAAADDKAFTFQDAVTWGMTRDEVLKNVSARDYEIEHERKLDYLEVEHGFRFEDMPAEAVFGFRDDALTVIQVSFDKEDRGVSEDAVMDALEKLYGTPEEVTDMKVVEDLMENADYDEIELNVRRSDIVKLWTLEDGTSVLIRIETHDDDIRVVFFEK